MEANIHIHAFLEFLITSTSDSILSIDCIMFNTISNIISYIMAASAPVYVLEFRLAAHVLTIFQATGCLLTQPLLKQWSVKRQE